MKPGDHCVDRSLIDKTAISFPATPRSNKAMAVTFALYEVGAKKSTIRPVGTKETYSTAHLSAPEDDEFLGGEIAILVEDDFIIACSLGNRKSVLLDAIGKLADKCEIELDPLAIDFFPVANKLTLEKIRSIGVKLVKFDAANYLGSVDMPKDGLISRIFGTMAADTDLKKDKMIAELSIHPRRLHGMAFGGTETPKNEWLKQTALKTFEDDEVGSYTIILHDDTEWKDGDLKLGRSVSVAEDGSTFNMPQALEAMLGYFAELKDGGHLR